MSTPTELCPDIDRARVRDLPRLACDLVLRSKAYPRNEGHVYRAQALVTKSDTWVEKGATLEVRAFIRVFVFEYIGTTGAGTSKEAIWEGAVEASRSYLWVEQAHPGRWDFGGLARPDELTVAPPIPDNPIPDADPAPCNRCGAVQGFRSKGEGFYCRVCGHKQDGC